MRKIAFTLMAILAMAGVSYAVTIDVVDNGEISSGLYSYTITATGTGVCELGQFTLSGTVNQNGGLWAGDSTAGGADDTCILYGDLRLPDVAGYTWDPAQGTQPTAVSVESTAGITNYDAGGPTWDAYLQTGNPSTTDVTVDLMQVVLAAGDSATYDITVWTATGTDFLTVDSYTDSGLIEAPAPPSLPGDANGDCVVDLSDLSILGTNWDSTTATGPSQGDFNGDGNVDLSDLSILGTNWGAVCPEGAVPTPEPSTIAMLILGALCLFGYRLRK